MDKLTSSRNQNLFPFSARPFTHAKAEAFARANAIASNNGMALAKGFTPSVDMSGVKFFGPFDEVDTLDHPWAPSTLDKIHRAAKERFEEERQKTASGKARDERIAQVELENKECFARKRLEEADRQLRRQALMAARKARSAATRPAIRPPRKRKQNAVDGVEPTGRRESISQSSHSSSTPINSDNNSSNGQTVIAASPGGTRIFHGKARHRPMVIDSDDEADLLPSPKRRCSSNNSSTEAAAGDKTQEASNGMSVLGYSDGQPVNGKGASGNDADPSDGEHLVQKRRRYLHVRRESNKENTTTKATTKGATTTARCRR